MAGTGGEVGVNGGSGKGKPAREIPDKILLLRILHTHLLPALPSPPPRIAPGLRSAPRVFPFSLSHDGGVGARGRREPGARPAAFPGAIAPSLSFFSISDLVPAMPTSARRSTLRLYPLAPVT